MAIEKNESVISAGWDSEKFKALQGAIQKKLGETALLSGLDKVPSLEMISTGDPIIDLLLSGEGDAGGWPVGKIIEIHGSHSSGKTTLVLEALAAFARAFPDKGILFVDTEGTFDRAYARHLGVPVDSERFMYSLQTGYGSHNLTAANYMIKSGILSAVVIDSLSMINTPKEKAELIGETQMMGQARLITDFIRETTPFLNVHKTTLFTVNQMRVNMTPMGAFGKKATGPEIMKFAPILTLEIRRLSESKADPDRILRVIKSKTPAKMGTEATFYLEHGIGIDRIASLISWGLATNTLEKKASWLTYKGHKLQGVESFRKAMLENAELRQALCKEANIPDFTPRGRMIRNSGLIRPTAIEEEEETKNIKGEIDLPSNTIEDLEE